MQELDNWIQIRKLESNKKLKRVQNQRSLSQIDLEFLTSFLRKKNYYICFTHYKLMHATRCHPFKMRCNSQKTMRRESTRISAFSLSIFYILWCLLLKVVK